MAESTATTRQAGHGPITKRRRAARACLSCRSRKVRCDVSRSGPPCMNCSLDSIACVVKARKPKSSSRHHGTQKCPDEEDHQSASPEHSDEHMHETPFQAVDSGVAETCMDTSDLGDLAAYNESAGLVEDLGVDLSTYHHHQDVDLTLTDSSPFGFGTSNPCIPGQRHTDNFTGNVYSPLTLNLPETPTLAENWLAECIREHDKEHDTGYVEGPAFHQRRVTQKNSVVYTYYPFLTLDNLFSCPPHDVDFMEAEGCFHLPTRKIMDQIVRQYFLHVHPLLPILNEGDFWEMYYNKRTNEPSTMSLLVFQAMMFVSCNFVNWSPESTRSIGYKSIRGLRATFYRRAKLLFDFGTESSPVAIAQAALLLSYWTPPTRTELRSNTVWLSIAVENAKNADAPYYATLPACPRPRSMEERVKLKTNNSLKRLWWCCVIRDRILPLGLRRGIQITRAHFDFERHQPLGLMDLDDEIHRSIVYSPDAKRELIQVLSHVLDLCVILTDVLLLVFPLDGALDLSRARTMHPIEEGKIRSNKKALVHWYTAAVATSTTASDDGAEIDWNKHESVVLYTHLMFTYYHSARMALYNHELQHYLTLVAENSPVDVHKLMETRDAIQNACSNITENIRGLSQRHLTRWLPISAVAYVAFPLALHVLNTHLSSSARQASSSATLIEVMMTMHNQYDGVHWVAKLVRYLVQLVQNDSRLSAGGRKAASWAELLTFKPRTYLRLALAMDLSMSSGHIPDQKDFSARVEAKVMRTLVGPERAFRILEGGVSPSASLSSTRRDTAAAATTDDLLLGADFFEMGSKAADSQDLQQDAQPNESDNAGASSFVADTIVVDGEQQQDVQQQQQPSCTTEMDFDGLSSLPSEMESFFDPILGDLAAAAGSSSVDDLARDFGSDNEAAMLTT